MTKTRFILPNAFTSMNFLLGVFSIVWAAGVFGAGNASYDQFRISAYFVVLCALLDKLDGFAARLVNASSEFGAQFDSLADLVAFGLAPGICFLCCYKANAPEWFSQNIPLLSIVFSIYVLCAAMRLAKYNAVDSDAYHHHFSGMPSTFAGGLNMVFIAFVNSRGLFENTQSSLIFLPVFVLLVTGGLMVSPLFLPKIQVRKSKFLNMMQAVLVVLTYIAGFFFISEKVPFTSEFLLIEMALYFVIGFGVGIVQRDQIIREAEESLKAEGKLAEASKPE